MATLDSSQALYTLLATNAGVSAIVGARVTPMRLMDVTDLPALSYTQVSGPRITTHDESAANSLAQKRYQIDCWANSYAVARQLADAVRTIADGYKGTVTQGADSLTIQGILIAGERDDYDAETRIYRIIQEYDYWHGG